MVKQRMASADVAAEVACLRQSIIGLRLANMYDLNPKVGMQQQVAAEQQQRRMTTSMHGPNHSSHAAAQGAVQCPVSMSSIVFHAV